MSGWLWMITLLIVAMVYTMLYHRVEPMIVLALLLCVSLVAISVVFIIDVKKDNKYLRKGCADIEEVEAEKKCAKINGQ